MPCCSFPLRMLALATVLAGGSLPPTASAQSASSEAGTVLQQPWWSFKKLRRPRVPRPEQGGRTGNPIDAFVLEKLGEKRLAPGPAASKATLLRRAYFDLLGLPPTPKQVEQFLQDDSPDAYENLIEELLASPPYGERWGRHWLEVVHYADGSGPEAEVYHPNAWRYRDYVIKSFNEDKPFDRFVQEQIAGDELFPDNLELDGFYDLSPSKLEHMEARVGTTLFALGPGSLVSHLDGEVARYQWLTEVVDKATTSFLGLTFKCARCHDHKFDPFSQEDYFKLQAVFAASEPTTVPVVASTTMGHRDESYHQAIALVEARDAYLKFVEGVKARVVAMKAAEYAPEVRKAYQIPLEARTPRERDLAAPLSKLQREMKIEEFLTSKEAGRYQELTRELAEAAVKIPTKGPAHQVDYDGFYDVPSATVLGQLRPELVSQTHLLHRGELAGKTRVVQPGLPRVLRDETISAQLPRGPHGPRYRRQLALWLTRPNHPLTARVMVNRIWQGHFGHGIVRTSNDFGRQGDPPSHPELLEWLACEFVDRGWSVKSMHRLIMGSDAYQRDSRFTTSEHRQHDPENRYLWRMNRRQLEADVVWDSIHAVAGNLNLKMGGRPAIPPLSEQEIRSLRLLPWRAISDDPSASRRRAIYLLARRSFPMSGESDSPHSLVSCPAQEVGTPAPQVLWTLKDAGLFKQARQLASRLVREVGRDQTRQVDLAWHLSLARFPSDQERQEALSLLERLASRNGAKPLDEPLTPGLAQLDPGQAAALTQFCLSVFHLDEFVSIE